MLRLCTACSGLQLSSHSVATTKHPFSPGAHSPTPPTPPQSGRAALSWQAHSCGPAPTAPRPTAATWSQTRSASPPPPPSRPASASRPFSRWVHARCCALLCAPLSSGSHLLCVTLPEGLLLGEFPAAHGGTSLLLHGPRPSYSAHAWLPFTCDSSPAVCCENPSLSLPPCCCPCNGSPYHIPFTDPMCCRRRRRTWSRSTDKT